MTPRSLILAGLLVLALVGVAQVASAAPERRVVVVVDASRPAAIDEARAAVAGSGGDAELRVPRDSTEQLSVTHYFAARGYDQIVGVGLDDRVAVDPVARKYPGTEFVAGRPGAIADALAR